MKIPPEAYADIVAAVRSGETQKAVADRHGVSRQRVNQICGAHGIERRKVAPAHSRDRAVLKLAHKGLRAREIAAALNASDSTIDGIMMRLGLRSRRKKEHAERRAMCVELRGEYSASQIGAMLGITRDAVIGHWFRARKQSGVAT